MITVVQDAALSWARDERDATGMVAACSAALVWLTSEIDPVVWHLPRDKDADGWRRNLTVLGEACRRGRFHAIAVTTPFAQGRPSSSVVDGILIHAEVRRRRPVQEAWLALLGGGFRLESPSIAPLPIREGLARPFMTGSTRGDGEAAASLIEEVQLRALVGRTYSPAVML